MNFTQTEGEHMPQVHDCINQCLDCLHVCVETLSYCNQQGKFPQLSETLAACVELCQANAKLMAMGSAYFDSLCMICCADACADCADLCADAPEDEQIKACGQVCDRTAQACNTLSDSEEQEIG